MVLRPFLCQRYFLAEIKGHDVDIWAKIKLFLAYSLYFRAILKEWKRKYRLAPIGASAKLGPAFTFVICSENSDAMRELTEILRPAYSVYTVMRTQGQC